MEKINIVVEENANWRLDKIVAKKMPEFSRTRIQEMINQGLVLVNQKMEKPSYKIRIGDQIEIIVVDNTDLDLEPENIPLR